MFVRMSSGLAGDQTVLGAVLAKQRCITQITVWHGGVFYNIALQCVGERGKYDSLAYTVVVYPEHAGS